MRKSRKAQFFVITAFTVVTIMFFISKWMEPYTIIDTSSVVWMEEPFVFNNIKEKAEYAINGSKSCADLEYNLEEYWLFAESYASQKGYDLDLNYTSSPCYEEPPIFPAVVAFKMTLKSPLVLLASNFTFEWEPVT